MESAHTRAKAKNDVGEGNAAFGATLRTGQLVPDLTKIARRDLPAYDHRMRIAQ